MRELSNEDLLTFLVNDYPQFGPGRVSSMLGYFGLTEDYGEDKIREMLEERCLSILNVDEYIETRLGPNHFLARPKEFSNEVQGKIDAINAGVQELKEAMIAKKSLKEIYQLTKGFEEKYGMKMLTLEDFE